MNVPKGVRFLLQFSEDDMCLSILLKCKIRMNIYIYVQVINFILYFLVKNHCTHICAITLSKLFARFQVYVRVRYYVIFSY